jgi:hypothetical protein
MDTNSEKQIYKVAMVKKITTPEGMPGNNWHRYVIRRDKSEIEGMKPGTLDSVTQHAESVAEDLNLRSGGAWTARKRVETKGTKG